MARSWKPRGGRGFFPGVATARFKRTCEFLEQVAAFYRAEKIGIEHNKKLRPGRMNFPDPNNRPDSEGLERERASP